MWDQNQDDGAKPGGMRLMKQPVPSGSASPLYYLGDPTGLWEGWRPLVWGCMVVLVMIT